MELEVGLRVVLGRGRVECVVDVETSDLGIEDE